jgi:NTP pyrophosphatase (non-canonical NTP hydrolase)
MNELDQYLKFVDGVTSDDSKYTETWLCRIRQLQDEDCDVARLLTAAIGMADEAGEVAGVVKKILFHGKPYDAANREHLIKELGDVMWYWAQACMALEVNPLEVIELNVKKLESRYPGGKFSIARSEIREDGDV